jgi:hypothetical protein
MQTNVLEPSIPDIYSDDGNQIGSEEIYVYFTFYPSLSNGGVHTIFFSWIESHVCTMTI